ncbi:glycoside hydrolase/phage tail family protein [Lentibacter sp. XHP0401]|uniref:baseplate multidomain protein megatron n=1 Tax=Lentibacter sp. XHP0401 TaxID=2984334 RepID=UPI0021E6E589|nr:glycoside hydrolase/phage tail family protein [Lentibacter sp. XHP0401]MCV2891764.1 glycoside hydrolase/phage tail family protein [Lentibacter sp. XHP0401]
MATILLSAAGAAIGGSVGGSVLGLSMAAVGRFAGASLGRAIDQSVMGQGSDVVEHGRVERFRLTSAGEGDPVAQVYGRMRVAGHVIWATQFAESVTTTGGGKGVSSSPKTSQFSYTVSMAIALCEGVISGVGRVWADGLEVDPESLGMRVYRGLPDQMPDPKMEAVEGAGQVPAYRGTAYVVLEELGLERFGNRVPQFEFEVMRPTQAHLDDADEDMAHVVQAVAMMPGSGEYTLATTPVRYDYGVGQAALANVNTPAGKADFRVATERMMTELPNLKASSLIVSWFGGDLRCGECELRPRVEQKQHDGTEMPWQVAGLTRAIAEEVPRDGTARPVYGGTPSDQSVIEAITHLHEQGVEVLYYPFILMDQLAENTLTDPYTGDMGQPAFPWRGRITLSSAPGQSSSSDGTAMADGEVAAFFGMACASDFTVANGAVTYSGPDEWSYSRFILHNAALCAAAGGVDSFSIGSEMRELTKIRGATGFVVVAALKGLAAEARALLGPNVKIGYCADWSEYFGFNDNGDRLFHLDPLWSDANIDFIGIDNYMPLSDWRDEEGEADEAYGSIYNLDYLEANILGGEGYDWFYHSPEARAAQIRTPIEDTEHSEPWVWRYKDIVNWWSSDHHERVNGVRSETPTEWIPQSKPIWFTELGCAAIDKGTNQPNKFLDPKSSESSLPHYSNGRRDDYLQAQYLRAMHRFWARAENNPVSVEYNAPMLDMSRAFVWAWDARPYPHFPALEAVWSDAGNYARGHWITGRASSRALSSVVAELCERAGLTAYDVSDLKGVVEGYAVGQVEEARASLQPLMLAYGFDAVERDGTLVFLMREGREDTSLDARAVALSEELEADVERLRASEAELMGRVRLRFIQSGADFETIAEEAVLPDQATQAVAVSELPLVMRRGSGRQIVERWLSEARVARDTLRFALPPSRLDVAAGDVLRLNHEGSAQLIRVDRVEIGREQIVEGVRIEPETYNPVDVAEDAPLMPGFTPPVPVFPPFLDLPLMRGDEAPHAPHLAVTAEPWPGSAALYTSSDGEGYRFDRLVTARSTVGVLETPLTAACAGLYDRGSNVSVRLTSGTLASVSELAMLNGSNLAAIGDGSPENWELVQFQNADLVAEKTYTLTRLLRGQLGSDAWQPQSWPAGSYFVLLDGRPEQVGLQASERGLERFYRVGPASRPYDDPSYTGMSAAFDGVGLRPLSPCHLNLAQDAVGYSASWIRRSRIGADSWELLDVPLGEDSESYLVRVSAGGVVLRESIVATPNWSYSAAQAAADGAGAGFTLSVAQISGVYGAGAFTHGDVSA